MAQAIVDRLEAVQIQEGDCEARARPRCVPDRRANGLERGKPVREPGQRIVARLELESFPALLDAELHLVERPREESEFVLARLRGNRGALAFEGADPAQEGGQRDQDATDL